MTRLRIEALRAEIAALEEKREAHVVRCGRCLCDEDSMLKAEIEQKRNALGLEESELLREMDRR